MMLQTLQAANQCFLAPRSSRILAKTTSPVSNKYQSANVYNWHLLQQSHQRPVLRVSGVIDVITELLQRSNHNIFRALFKHGVNPGSDLSRQTLQGVTLIDPPVNNNLPRNIIL